MVKSQLVELLKKFTPEELRELQLFVASPYFNRGVFVRETQDLLAWIMATSPNFPENKLNRELIIKSIFGANDTPEGKLNKVMSELHKIAKDFISVKSHMSKENEFSRLIDQASFFRLRSMDNRYLTTIQKLEDLQKSTQGFDLSYFEQQLRLDYELYKYKDIHNRKKDDIHIEKTLKSLYQYYFSLKTELLNRYLLQQKITLLEIPSNIYHTIEVNQFPEYDAESFPVLNISYKIFRLLEKDLPNTNEFDDLYDLLRKNELAIRPDLLKSYYTFIRNFCVLLVNGGQTEFLPMLFKLQKEHYERGYMHHYGGKISATAFLSLSNAALKLGELEWTKEFIDTHKGRVLDDNENEDYHNLILSNYYFHTREYDKALDILPAAFQDLDFHLFSRRLELKIYYELNSDLLPFKIDAFKMYLSRASQKVLSPAARDRNANFVNLLFQLHGTHKGDKTRVGRLLERINEKRTVTDREWLLDKAQSLA
jgi:hypothetical protein